MREKNHYDIAKDNVRKIYYNIAKDNTRKILLRYGKFY